MNHLKAQAEIPGDPFEVNKQVPGKNLPQTPILFKTDLIPLHEFQNRVRPAISVEILRIGGQVRNPELNTVRASVRSVSKSAVVCPTAK